MLKHIGILWGLSCGVALAATTPSGSSTTGRNSSTFSGTVAQYLLAPRGEVEGVLMKDGTTVHFPASLAGLLTAQVKPGDKVTVTAPGPVPPSSPQGRGVRAVSITAEKNNRTITEQGESNQPSPPSAPNAGHHMEVRGHIVRVLRNDAGEAEGVLLSTGPQVRMAPETGNELAKLNETSPGGELRVSGMGVKTDYGTVIDALGVKYDGKALTSRKHEPSTPGR